MPCFGYCCYTSSSLKELALIDVNHERLLSLADACKEIPGRPHISTLHRWRLRGVRGHRLETVLIGGRRFTSAEAIQEFIAATTAHEDGRRDLQIRQPSMANVERELDRLKL